MRRITIDELMSRLGDLSTDESEIAEYFILDPEGTEAFSPAFQLNPETVVIPVGPEGEVRSAMVLNLANWFARMRRQRAFVNRLAGGYSGPIIVAEGDSWWQYPLKLKDTIDHLMEPYAVHCVSAAGDLLGDMAAKAEYIPALRDTNASILLLSGGGNDLLRRGQLANHLESYHVDLKPGDYLKPSFEQVLAAAFGDFERILRDVHGAFPHVQILVHGYDYALPNRGPWLGRPMERRGINDRTLQAGIAVDMMDRFNRGLRRMVTNMPHVTYIDCRNTVGSHRWYDELHPTDDGYGDVAAKFAREIAQLANRRRDAPIFVPGGAFGTPEALQHRARSAARAAALDDAPVERPKGRAVSLHLGLNFVDPQHYSGWDGALLGCENDAIAMERLARGQGFETTLLLTEDATRQAMIDRIAKAAEDLHAGDMLMITMAGHGGRLPDWNGDEEDDGTGTAMDETLCLFDSQVVDDELYVLWSRFREGVRILYVADTCHSGTPIRVNPFSTPMPEFPNAGMLLRPRCMPRNVESKTWRQNLDEYRSRASSYARIDSKVLLNPLDMVVKADVMGLGACQDHQFAYDGDEHGAFTAAMLRVWDQGRYRGDYVDLRDRVEREIGMDIQIPNLDKQLLRDPGFARQQPFSLWPKHAHDGGAPRPGASLTVTTATTAGGKSAPALPTAAGFLRGEEGDEPDDAPSPATRSAGTRSASASWPQYGAFRDFITGLGLKHFKPEEFLMLGGSHGDSGSACFGKNQFPPSDLWMNIATTAQVLDRFRARLGKPITITNAYRAPAYNACIGGASSSLHLRFNALDFKVSGLSAIEAAQALRWMRDAEGAFNGGIGYYNSFVHIDTRGANVEWSGKGVPKPPAPVTSPFGAAATPAAAASAPPAAPRDQNRAAFVRAIPLAADRRGGAKVTSAYAQPVPRSGGPLDLDTAALEAQQALKAAVTGSGVVSLFDTLSPGQKEDVLLSTLFAQRAADHAHDPIAAREDWYRLYLEVLTWLGWVRLSDGVEMQEKLKSDSSFESVALGALSAVATGNQHAIVKSALDAMKKLGEEDGAIKLFDFQTSRSSGSSFQLASAEAAGADVAMALGAFAFVHSDTQKNILFVSWGRKKVEFWLSAQRLILGNAAYDEVREIVKDRLGATRRSLIANIPLG
ncbi:caspase family protein [Pararhodobacter sp. SW119]|uniref:D-Ala-D-Ala carboxypeptidase family metallohydrolase n=1 Tax=Pararhodobacter sp. SW119 TaxID=2780075 RepID=UPI001AE00A3E|nr:caspase family protein [Pararhodobacter sp. SW119]